MNQRVSYLPGAPAAALSRALRRRGAIIDIETMQITEGRLPPAVRRLTTDWGLQHRVRLLENWRRVMQHERVLWIEPPE